MLRSDGLKEPERSRRNNLNRNESLRSDRSERKVSFNKSVGVKHIPKGAKKHGRPQTTPSTTPRTTPDADEWQRFTQVSHEPVSLDSKQLIEAAEDLVRVVDTIDCGTTPTTPYYSLDRPGRGKSTTNHHNLNYPARNSDSHHDYANVVVTPGRSRTNNHLSSGSGVVRGSNQYLNSTAGTTTAATTGTTTATTTTTTIPNNYYQNNYHNYHNSLKTTRNHIQRKLKKTDVNRLQKPLKPLRSNSNSNSNPSLAPKYDHRGLNDHHDHHYKSVPDLRTTTYLNQDFDHRYDHKDDQEYDDRYDHHKYDQDLNQYDQGLDRYDSRYDQGYDHKYDQGYDQGESKMSYHHNDHHQRKVERIIQKFNQETTFFGTTPGVEPNDHNSHNNNQPFSYTRGQSPVRNDQGYTQVQRKRLSDDHTHRKWEPDDYGERKRDLNDYSAKIIITDDYKYGQYDYDDDHAYESYQIPDDLAGKSTSHDLNINMASVGVQTDQASTRGRTRGRPTTRPPLDPDTRHRPSPRGRSYESTTRMPHMKPRNDLYDLETTNHLTSATLVRQMNHNFGRSDRSPSPPARMTTPTTRTTRYNVVPLLSDASDTEYDQKRPRDPLARIRTQVMARERQQEEEEEEESRNLPVRPQVRPPVRPEVRPGSIYDDRMTPLTIDEVDALSLVMEDNKKSLVVASESSKAHTTTTTRHTTTHRTREAETTTREQRKRENEGLNREIENRESEERIREARNREARVSRSTTPRRDEDDKKKKKKKEEEEEEEEDEKKKKGDKKKKRKIKIKFFYERPQHDPKVDPLENFEEFKGEDYDYDQDDNLNRSLSEKYTQEDGKKKKNYLSLGRDGGRKKEEKEQRGTTPTTTPYSSASLGRPRGREKVKNTNNNYNNRFSTLQQQSRGRSRRSSGSVSSSPTPRPAKPKQQQVKKPRYFGDTDLEDYQKPTTTTTITTTTTTTPAAATTATITTRQPPQGPGDYRSLPSRVEGKNSRRIVRRRSPNSSSQHNSSESEVDSHASKASRVSTGSNRSVYLHATAVADIPVRSSGSSRQTDRQTERQTDRQTKKVTRSFSLLSPWKPRHYRERYEIDYDRKTQLPPRPPRRPQPQQQQQQQNNHNQHQQKGSKLSTWLRRKKNKEAKGI